MGTRITGIKLQNTGKIVLSIPNSNPIWVTGPTIIGTRFQTVNLQLTATDPDGIIDRYEIISGTLPTNLVMSSSGNITGTYQQYGNFTILVRAYDNEDGYVDRQFDFQIANTNNTPIWVTGSGSLGTFNEGEILSIQLQVTPTNGIAISTYQVLSGSLPSGVTVSNTGLISGTLPDVSGNTTYNFTIRATNIEGEYSDRSFSLTSNDLDIINGLDGVIKNGLLFSLDGNVATPMGNSNTVALNKVTNPADGEAQANYNWIINGNGYFPPSGGTPGFWNAGNTGAMYLNGGTNYTRNQWFRNNNTFTYEMWVWVDANASGGYIFTGGTGMGDGPSSFRFRFVGTRSVYFDGFTYDAYPAGQQFGLALTGQANVGWQQWCFSYNENGTSFFTKNGVYWPANGNNTWSGVQTQSYTATLPSNINYSPAFFNRNTTNTFMISPNAMRLSILRLYNRNFTLSEIQDNYNAKKSLFGLS